MTDYEQNQKMFDLFSGFRDVVFAGVLWIVASLPVFTLGISSSALYHVIMKSVREKKGDVFKEFFSFFCQNFKRMLVSTLVCIPIAACIVLGLYISVENSEGSQIWEVFSYAYRMMMVFLIMVGIFIFPSYTHSTETGFKALHLGVSLCIKHLFTSFTLAILVIIAVCITFYMPALILITPGLTTLIITMVLERYLNEDLGVVYLIKGAQT